MAPPNKSNPTPVTRSLESGVTFWTPAQIEVVLVQVGDDVNARFIEYSSLVCRFASQLRLRNVQPFYRAEAKSPFKFYPWRSGTMNFRFVVGRPEDLARRRSPLACLHASRNTKAVIGILCTQDPGALSVRFDGSDTPI